MRSQFQKEITLTDTNFQATEPSGSKTISLTEAKMLPVSPRYRELYEAETAELIRQGKPDRGPCPAERLTGVAAGTIDVRTTLTPGKRGYTVASLVVDRDTLGAVQHFERSTTIATESEAFDMVLEWRRNQSEELDGAVLQFFFVVAPKVDTTQTGFWTDIRLEAAGMCRSLRRRYAEQTLDYYLKEGYEETGAAEDLGEDDQPTHDVLTNVKQRRVGLHSDEVPILIINGVSRRKTAWKDAEGKLTGAKRLKHVITDARSVFTDEQANTILLTEQGLMDDPDLFRVEHYLNEPDRVT
jgi:hypothetical protein